MELLLETGNLSTKDFTIINEAYDSIKKGMRIRGPYIMCESENRNKRIYLKSTVQREVDKYRTAMIETKQSIGELSHPHDKNIMFEINLDRGCHLIESLEWDGNNVIGTSLILEDLPMGRIAKSYLNYGIALGISTRAGGTVGPGNIVNEDFALKSLDMVHFPSAQNAYVDCIRENYNYIIDNNPLLESVVTNFEKEIGNSRLVVKEAFNDFIRSMRLSKGLLV